MPDIILYKRHSKSWQLGIDGRIKFRLHHVTGYYHLPLQTWTDLSMLTLLYGLPCHSKHML